MSGADEVKVLLVFIGRVKDIVQEMRDERYRKELRSRNFILTRRGRTITQ